MIQESMKRTNWPRQVLSSFFKIAFNRGLSCSFIRFLLLVLIFDKTWFVAVVIFSRWSSHVPNGTTSRFLRSFFSSSWTWIDFCFLKRALIRICFLKQALINFCLNLINNLTIFKICFQFYYGQYYISNWTGNDSIQCKNYL